MKDTPKSSDIPAQTRGITTIKRPAKRRAIDARTIDEVARLVARSLTESEACRLIGIQPSVWFDMKSRCRRSEKFAARLEHFRAKRIDGLVARVEKSAEGIDVKQPDFRAALALLSHVDARRYSDSGQRASVAVDISVSGNRETRVADFQHALAVFQQSLRQEQPVIDLPAEPKLLKAGPGKDAK
jgi:hypothetical protein